MRACFERLETRLVPAATFDQVGGMLLVSGDQFDNTITLAPDPAVPGQVILDVDGRTATFQGVTLLSVEGRQGDDTVSNQTAIPALILGGSGRDNLVDFGRPNGTTGSFLDGGPGADSIYAITASVLVRGGAGADRLVVSVQAVILDVDDRDLPPVVFGLTQTTPVQLINGVVYFQGTAADDSASIVQDGNGNFAVTYNGQLFAFDRGAVDAFAGLFGPGNDLVDGRALPRDVRLVAYGAGGDDTLLGGDGDDLLKGGSDDDFASGGQGDDDLTGDSGLDALSGGAGKDTIRNLDGIDLVFRDDRDLLVQLGLATPRQGSRTSSFAF